MKWKLGLYRGLQGLGFPKIRGTLLRVLIIWIIVFWGLCWGLPTKGNYHVSRNKAFVLDILVPLHFPGSGGLGSKP